LWFPGWMVQERGFLWYDGHVADYSHDSILWATQHHMQVYHLTFSDEVSSEDITDHFDLRSQCSYQPSVAKATDFLWYSIREAIGLFFWLLRVLEL
jgi:hypothetical protein